MPKLEKLLPAVCLGLYIFCRYGNVIEKAFTHPPTAPIGLQGVDPAKEYPVPQFGNAQTNPFANP
jgi:hypothetical protein